MPSAPNGPRVRIVADTNTLVSGSLWSGNPGRLLDAVKAGKLTLVQTPQLWVEFVEVLNRPKFLARLRLLGLTPTMLAEICDLDRGSPDSTAPGAARSKRFARAGRSRGRARRRHCDG